MVLWFIFREKCLLLRKPRQKPRQMEASDRAGSSDSIDVISLESKSSVQTDNSSRASFLIPNSPPAKDNSTPNLRDIEQLNKLVKLKCGLKTNQTGLCSPNIPPNFSTEYDSTSDRLTSTLKNCFYKFILFKCFKIQLPSDD